MKKIVAGGIVLLLIGHAAFAQNRRIVNIVNFIRLLEPRDENITETVLYQTVVNQIALMRKHHLGGTFLLQYDALMDPRYQQLLKALPRDSFEIGAWWEIPQPLVENSGMKWRGRYPWDWHTNVGFSTGYTPKERKMLVDKYMADFRKVFGYYPKSVASWFIDAYTLNYMYERYHIVASANCKDQYGTDGYTLWGGYWNQAYFPSRVNAYMPAQHKTNQIPVPIFRMLGSDPIRQYDEGIGQERQGVITLEPVYSKGGGDSAWVNWFFNQFVNGASMAFAYTQVGQENSFTWKAMKKGLEIQLSRIEELRNEGKIQIETLAESGEWFKKTFPVTPSTSVTALEDLAGGNKKTVWFDSRFYRANLLWEDNTLRFRDIHLFNEDLRSPYMDKATESNECRFLTLPFVDGHLWSKKDTIAGLRFKTIINGKAVDIVGLGNPSVTDDEKGKLGVRWHLKNIPGTLILDFSEKGIHIHLLNGGEQKWFLDLEAADNIALPFRKISSQAIDAFAEKTAYSITLLNGYFSRSGRNLVKVIPEGNKITLKFR